MYKILQFNNILLHDYVSFKKWSLVGDIMTLIKILLFINSNPVLMLRACYGILFTFVIIIKTFYKWVINDIYFGNR